MRTLVMEESRALAALAVRIGPAVVRAADALARAKGRIIATGVGKAGLVAQKFSATLASTGTSSFFIHPTEAAHGDLGRLAKGDIVVAFSNSGETVELLALVRPLQQLGVEFVAICGEARSPLARAAAVVVALGTIGEADSGGLVPTVSVACMAAVADALVLTIAARSGFSPAAYARFHPGGKLGRSARTVREVMRSGRSIPMVSVRATVAEAIVTMTDTAGRPGAALVVDGRKKLLGIFTDGDLRRLARRGALEMGARITTAMTASPMHIGPDELVLGADAKMRTARVDQLPVVDGRGRAIGLLDVQDLLARD